MGVWPCLVQPWACNASIEVWLFSGADESGDEGRREIYSGRCSYSEKSKSVLDSQRRQVLLSASALIPGDIAPGEDISGEAVVSVGNSKVSRRIFQASRARNPDGTVNFTQLELM